MTVPGDLIFVGKGSPYSRIEEWDRCAHEGLGDLNLLDVSEEMIQD